MNILETLLTRNEAYAALSHEARSPLPRLNTIIISCLDARTDPAHMLGIEPGEALVLRNAGGRVTETVERELGVVLAMVAEMTGRPPRPQIVLVQHTQCGMENLARPEVVSSTAEVPKTQVDGLAIVDHATSLHRDAACLRASAHLPSGLDISCLRYDEETGRAEVVSMGEQ